MIIILIIILICILIFLYLTRQYILYQKLIELKQNGKGDLKNVNLLYDDYYDNSENKKNNKLICQIGNISLFYKSKFQYELDMLELKPNTKYKILIVSSLNLDLELEILSKYPQVEIIAFSDNLLNTKFLSNKIKNIKGITLGYSDPYDIKSNFSKSLYKFDRILVRECLGNIANRNKFFSDMNHLLNKNGFMFIKTFVFNPLLLKNNTDTHHIFSKQKEMIDFWNYNFSTTQSIINDLTNNFKKIKFSEVKFTHLFYLYGLPDFKQAAQIYFFNMGKNIRDLSNWSIVSSMNLLVLKVYKDS